MRLAVIGTGNMGKALVGGFISGGIFKPEEINCYDVYEQAAVQASEMLGINKCSSASEAVSGCDYVLMAVKPVHFDDALKGIKDDLADSAIVLSIAAAVTCLSLIHI